MTTRATGLVVALLALAGCTGGGKVDIRAVGNVNSVARSPSERTALASGQLAIGNVGLALEGFRRAAQEDPSDVDALLGVAACYDRMERFDLSRRAYEQALAVAPGNPALYDALAASLDAQGLATEAGAVRREAEGRREVAQPTATNASGSAITPPKPLTAPGASITIMLPPPRPVEPGRRAVRLERLSQGEVALLTSPRSPWPSRPLALAPTWTAIDGSARARVVVLNGARIAGLAARTRLYLGSRGIAASRIGDNPSIATRSIVRFVPNERRAAQRIVAQFPFAALVAVTDGPLTLIVGRDAPAVLLRRG